MKRQHRLATLAGVLAGAVNGLFGGGGGMAAMPLLERAGAEGQSLFATCLALTFPITLISAAAALGSGSVTVGEALPYLIGGLGGGIAGGMTFRRVDPRWLKGIFSVILLYSGVRYLC